MSHIIDATLRFIDNFSTPLKRATSQLENSVKHFDKLSKQAEKTGRDLENMGKKLTTSLTVPIIGAGIGAYKLAMDFEETKTKVSTVFGDMSEDIMKWSEDSLYAYGISQGGALEMVSLFGDMGTAMGQTQKDASQMSMNLVALAGDLASFKNISAEQGRDALKGIYTGETESLKNLGIVMNDAMLQDYLYSKGIESKLKDLTQAQKVQLRYNYVMEKSKNAINDFKDENDSASNQLRIFTEGIKQLATNYGKTFLDSINSIVMKMNEFVKKLESLDDEQKKTIVQVLGLVAVLGPLTLGLSKVVLVGANVFKTMSTIGKGLKAGQKLLKIISLSFKANLIVAGIMAVLVAGFLIYKNWDKIKNKAIELWAKVKDVFGKMGIDTSRLKAQIEKFKEGFWAMVTAIKEEIGRLLDEFRPFALKIKDIFELIIPAAIGYAKGIFAGWVETIVNLTENVMVIFNGLITFITGVFNGNWEQAWQGIKDIFMGVIAGIYDLFTGNINKMINGINGLLGGLNGLELPDWLGGGEINIGFQIPTIPSFSDVVPAYAKGTDNHKGGLALTQEKGGEILDLPSKTRVYPNDKSIMMAYEDGQKSSKGSITINKIADSITVRNDSDIDMIVEKLVNELTKIQGNTDGGVFA